MKKIITLLLAALMILNLGAVAMAEEEAAIIAWCKENGVDLSLMPAAEQFNFTNNTVKFFHWTDQATLDAAEEGLTNRTGRAAAIVKELYGLDVEAVYVGMDDIVTKMSSLVISGEAPEVIHGIPEAYYTYITEELVEDMTDEIDFEHPIWATVKDITKATAYNGKYYLLYNQPAYPNSFIYYWVSDFEEAGLETPRQLYEKGEWTLEKMEELMNEVAQDVDRDGVYDIYGMSGFPQYALATTGVDIVKYAEDGTWVENLDDPKLAPFFNFFYNTSKAGSGSRHVTYNYEQDFFDHKVVMLWDEQWVLGSVAAQMKEGNIEFVPSPRIDANDTEMAYNEIVATRRYVGKNCANPDGAKAFIMAEILLAMTSEEKALASAQKNYGEKCGAWYREYVNNAGENQKYTFCIPTSNGIPGWSTTEKWWLYGNVMEYEFTWSHLIEYYKPYLVARLDPLNAAIIKAQEAAAQE